MELEMDVEDLLNKRKLESDRIEFKTGWNPDDIYHSVCAFANDYNKCSYIIWNSVDICRCRPTAQVSADALDIFRTK